MNTIAIVCHSRPECLQIHLEQLLKNPELSEYLVHFFPDYGASHDIYKVIKNFRHSHKNIKVTTRSEIDSKKSPLPAFYNIFDAYRVAAEESDEFVLPAEEDIIPTEDYLRYHRKVYDNFLSKYDKIFCAGTKRRQITEQEGNPELLIGDRQLCQPTIISVKMIQKYITPLLKNQDFWTPWIYNQKYFATLRNPPHHHIHHDGQLERIAEANNLWCLKPDHARSAHIGIAGQHFAGTVEGNTLQEKVKYMKSIMLDGEALRSASENPKDMCALPKTLEWDDLYLDLDRDKVLTQMVDFDRENKFKEYIDTCDYFNSSYFEAKMSMGSFS